MSFQKSFLDFQDFEPGESWEAKVSDDELIWLLSNFCCSLVSVSRLVDRIAFLLDRGRKHLPQAILVFDEENLHPSMILDEGASGTTAGGTGFSPKAILIGPEDCGCAPRTQMVEKSRA